MLDDGNLQYDSEGEGLDGCAVCWWLGDFGAGAGPGKDVATRSLLCLSGSPLPRFLRLHLSVVVVGIFQVRRLCVFSR